MIVIRALAAAFCAASLFVSVLTEPSAAASDASGSIIIRAGKSDNPNHALARQFAEAIAVAVNGAYTLDVQESQGSVQNVIDSIKDAPNTIFTATPSIIAQARHGAKPFAPDPHYNDIRSLFPIPAQTLHWVVRQDSGITTLPGLAGHSLIPGVKGGVSERLTATALQVLGIDRQVQLIDIDAAAAPAALKDNQVSGMALAGSYPLPSLLDLAHATPIRLLGLSPDELARILAADDGTAAEIVPKGTYPGQDDDVTTIAVPAGAYTTARMSDATAYAITKAFWSQNEALVQRNPPWQAVKATALEDLKIKLHRGALRYYTEAGITVPPGLR